MKYNAFVDASGIASEQLRFLSRAVSDNVTRPFMRYIHIEPSDKEEGGLLGVATDGKRYHLIDPINKDLVEVFGLTAGYWKALKSTAKNIWLARLDDSVTNELNFPNWRKVAPAGEAVYKTTFVGFNANKLSQSSKMLSRFFHDLPETTVINLEFLKALGENVSWNVEWFGQVKPMRFTEGNRVAVIMPMQP